MQPNTVANDRSRIKKTNKMFDQALYPVDLIYLALADRGVGIEETKAFLFERYDIYKELMERPYVGGRDLINAGINPGDGFKAYLAYAHKLRLAGVEKETALKQTIEYVRKSQNEKTAS